MGRQEKVAAELRWQTEAWRHIDVHARSPEMTTLLRPSLPDDNLIMKMQDVLRQTAHAGATSSCTWMRSVRVTRVHPIVNDDLWADYRKTRDEMARRSSSG